MEKKRVEVPYAHRCGHPVWTPTVSYQTAVMTIKRIESVKGEVVTVCSDEVPGPLDGTAEHHAEDHAEDLRRRNRKG